jgi:phosphoglycerate dehydrogenase-like enzyme
MESVSRRGFLSASGSVSAAAAVGREPAVVPTILVSNMQAPGDPLVIVTRTQFTPEEIQQLRGATSRVKVDLRICASAEQYARELPNAEVVFGNLTSKDLPAARGVKWVQSGAAGVEWMDEGFRNSSIVLTNVARVFAHGITETAMGMLLCLTRGISKYYIPQFYKRTMKPVGTARSDHHTELAGRMMGIVGFGGIGSMLARRAHFGFDMRIVATDAKPLPKPEWVEELREPGWFMEMAPKVDVLVAAAPQTPLTTGMFNESVFRSMKKTAYFLALSRGPLYDDVALARALKEGWIAGAGLDVTPVEPPPPDNPLFDSRNVVMTAHTSGWSPDRQVRLMALYAENIRRYAEGLALINVVDKKAGY